MADEDFELWEAQTGGTYWVQQRDARSSTGYRNVKVGGPNATKRLRISTADRELTQEMILEENAHLDPFKNGALRRVDGGTNEGIVTDDDLADMLELGSEAFEEMLRDVDNELTVRRLRELVEKQGTVPQLEIIQNVIEEKWKVGGTQKTVREMIEAQELAGGEVVSG